MKKDSKDIFFVGIQLLLFVCFLFDFEQLELKFGDNIHLFGSILFVLGMLIVLVAIVQLNRNLSVFPTPKANSTLIVTGLYKYIRHPIYTGILTAGLGFSFYSDSGLRLIVTLLLFILFYFKSKYEEEKLKEIFPEYPDYIKKSGRFIPWL